MYTGSAPYYLSDNVTLLSEIHEYTTRNPYHLKIPLCHTNSMKKTFKYSGANIWNTLPLHIQRVSTIMEFRPKSKLKKHILYRN